MGDEPLGWTDEDDALVAYELLPDWHPALFMDAFRAGLDQQVEPGALLATFVTPESLPLWGDLSRARAVLSAGLKISTTALYGVDAPDVAYVRLVETSRHTNDSVDQAPATMHATLVWRPEIAIVPKSSWRIHHLGDAIRPDLVPRTSSGFDPPAGR